MRLNRYFSTAIAAIAATCMLHGNINGGNDVAYLERGVFYLDASLPNCALDQLSHYNMIADPAEESALAEALSAVEDNAPQSVELLRRFLNDYPASGARWLVTMAIGNHYLDKGEWGEACRWYEKVPAEALDDKTDGERRLRLSLSLINLGELDGAERELAGVPGETARFLRGYTAYAKGDYATARGLLQSVDGKKMPEGMAPWYLCQINYMNGDYAGALEQARRLLRLKNVPTSYQAEASRIAGEALYNQGEDDTAVEYLERYVRNVSGEPLPSSMYILGMCRYRTGDYRGALDALKSPSSLNDAMGQSSLLTMGQSHMALGDMSAATIVLEKAVGLDADESVTEEAYYNYCVARSDGGHVPFGSSVSVFENFLKRFPRSRYASKVSEYLAYGYMTDDNYEAALASIDRIAHPTAGIMSARQHVLYMLGSRDLAGGEYDNAVKYLTEALSIKGADDNTASECRLLLGECYYKLKDYAKAVEMYTSYLKTAPAGAVNRRLALYDLGYAYFALKEYEKSSESFTRLVTGGGLPKKMEADAVTRMADCSYAMRNLDAALAGYDNAARIEPSTADYPMYQRGTVLGWKGDIGGQIDALNTMIARFPKSPIVPMALMDIAEAYTAEDQYDNAIMTYRRIERMYPGTAQGRQAMLLMGALQSGKNRQDEAFDTYCRLIKGNSPSEEATRASVNLQALAVEQGRLNEYLSFMETVPNAPSIDRMELEKNIFAAANTAAKLNDYLTRYPQGQYVPQALLMLAREDVSRSDNEAALMRTTRLLELYPDGELASEALSIKADAEINLGLIPEAAESYRRLEMRADDAAMLNKARMGLLHTSRYLGNDADVITVADMLLSSSSLGSGQQREVTFMKAVALTNTERGAEGAELWRTLCDNTTDITGTKSLYYLAQYYHDNGDSKQSWEYVNRLVDSNTPHSYWLARGYILLSDLYRERGDNFEADEYLKSLRTNYPGSEPDIFNMIDSRLQ